MHIECMRVNLSGHARYPVYPDIYTDYPDKSGGEVYGALSDFPLCGTFGFSYAALSDFPMKHFQKFRAKKVRAHAQKSTSPPLVFGLKFSCARTVESKISREVHRPAASPIRVDRGGHFYRSFS